MQRGRDVLVRLYRPGDEEGLVALLQQAFGGWPKLDVAATPRDHVLWKLSSSPEAPRFQVVAEAAGKIVGCRLFLVNRFLVGGQSLLCRQGFDLAIDRDYRGRGVLEEMWAFARQQFDDENDFNFGVGEHPAALRMRATQGNITIENKVQVLVHRMDGPSASARTESAFDVREANALDGRMDTFFAEAASQFDFIRERTKEYLTWRYLDPRGGPLTMKVAERDGRVLGYVALRVSEDVGKVADVLALPGRLDVVEGLVRSAVEGFRTSGAARAECWVPSHHPYREVLLSGGFSHKRRVVPLSYRYLRAPAEQLAFLQDPRAAVHITSGDTDLV